MSTITVPMLESSRYQELAKITLKKEEEKKRKQVGKDFCKELDEMGIHYMWLVTHPEVVGCSESRSHYERYKQYLGSDYSVCKHLVVHERKGDKRTFLIIVDDEKSVDLKELKEKLGCGKLEFVSSGELDTLLHTIPGNVSLFNMKFDEEKKVELVIDQELLDRSLVAFHPLYNGMSLFMKPKDMVKYLEKIKRDACFLDVPSKEKEEIKLVKTL